ncbi:MAG: glycoside hydrolase family 43 protein [Lacisediminihabitans sp.]
MINREPSGTSHYLLAFFRSELYADGEQVRFAVSNDSEPTTWTELNGGHPVLWSTVGERGTRDPFLIRDEARKKFVIIATDLRVFPGEDWERATRHGSRNIVVWESSDLVKWDGPHLREVSKPSAGNTWAPKAYWSVRENRWLVFWASAIFDDDRSHAEYQRMMVSATSDFQEFTPTVVHLDAGHDIIDLTFLEDRGVWYRFSVNALSATPQADVGHHILEEVGRALEDQQYETLAIDIGKDVMVRAEGPAVSKHPVEDRWYLLADEFGLRGYQLFETSDLTTGAWAHRSDAKLPEGARHGSLLPITSIEREMLLAATWPTP